MPKLCLPFVALLMACGINAGSLAAEPAHAPIDKIGLAESQLTNDSDMWEYRSFEKDQLDFYINMRDTVLDKLHFAPQECSPPKDDASYDLLRRVVHQAYTQVVYNTVDQLFMAVIVVPDSPDIEKEIPLAFDLLKQCPRISMTMDGDVFGWNASGAGKISKATARPEEAASKTYSYNVRGHLNVSRDHEPFDDYAGTVHALARLVRNIWMVIVDNTPRKETTVDKLQVQKILQSS